MDRNLTYLHRSRVCCVLFSATTLVLVVLLNWPWDYVTISSASYGEAATTTEIPLPESHETMRRGGWPWTYCVIEIAKDQTAVVQQVRYFSTIRLVGDIAIGTGLVLFAWSITAFRARRIFLSLDSSKTRLRFDVATAMSLFLVPLTMLGWALLVKRSHDQFRRQMDSQSRCLMTAEAPAIIASRFPKVIQPLFHRVRSVVLFRPTTPQLANACRLSTLRFLSIGGLREGNDCTFDFSRLHELTQLNFEFCSLNVTQTTAISKQRLLGSLSLYGCALTESTFAPIASMEKLRRVDLRRAGLQSSFIGRPVWADTVESLLLSRPLNHSDELKLSDWPQLRHLSARSNSLKPNDKPFIIKLVRLPKLESIYLDRLQKHQMTLHDLPELRFIEEPSLEFTFDFIQPSEVYGLTWLEKLEVIDVPKLASLKCSAHDLNHFHVEGTRRLEAIQMGSYQTLSRGIRTIPLMSPDAVVQWVDQISQIDSLTSIDLSTLPLAGVDLKPLCRLKQLQQIRLDLTAVDDEQLLCLCNLTTLKRLTLGDCKVSESVFNAIVSALPDLESLQGDLSQVNDLSLARRTSLRNLETSEFHPKGKFELVNLPRLSGRLRVGGQPSSLKLVQLPRLEEMVISSPWPRHAELKGLPSLRCFSGGGQELNDEVIDVLLTCGNLDTVTIAYANVSREKLTALQSFPNLTGLHVPGCGVDDAITDHWRNMERLRSVCLDDSPIGTETLEWLQSLPSLRRLSLSRVPLNEKSLARLRKIDQVSELCLDGCRLSDNCLDQMLMTGNLESLDLSRVELTNSIWNQLQNAKGLKHLVLHGNAIDAAQLQQTMSRQTQMTVDVDAATEATMKMEYDVSPRRFISYSVHPSFSFISSHIEDLIIGSNRVSTDLKVLSDDAVMEGYRKTQGMDAKSLNLN